jgi:dTDP-4-dehydrorhamnose reductase
MKALFTGMNGTVAPPVATYFKEHGFDIVHYDRNKVSTHDKDEIELFILEQKIDLLLHFAMGSYDWTSILAILCKKHHIPFVFISTVSVFSNDQRGPYLVDSTPDAKDDYGLYKRESERLVRENNKEAYIIRLGWQIGLGKGKNQMIDFLFKQMEDQGFISASSLWYPSASFLTDSAQAIYQVTQELPPALYQINSNESYTFFEIVTYLSQFYPEFVIKENKDFNADHRMIDDRVKIRKLAEIFNRK